MKSSSIDTNRFKAQNRHSMIRRRMSRNSSVFNGVDDILDLDYDADEGVKQVINLAAAYHNHISCATDLCIYDRAHDPRALLPCELDHLYTNINDIKNRLHATASSATCMSRGHRTVRDMLICQLDLLSHLQDEILKKNRLISNLLREIEKLKNCLQRWDRRMCLLRRSYPVSSEDESADNNLEGALTTTMAPISSESTTLSTPVLATRYFGRRSKTVPSRALKRRYLGPPKILPKRAVLMNASSTTTSVSSASEMLDESFDKQETLSLTEMKGAIDRDASDVKKKHKKCSKRPKPMTRKTDFLTTDKTYFLADFRTLPDTITISEIDVPCWKVKPVTSFYQMEGTENINDPVFHRRHMKFEQDERRRKRWDMQRLREQKAIEKMKYKNYRNGDNPNRKAQSFYPDSRHIEYIEVTEQLPVTAFGHPIPLFQPCEFSLSWRCEEPLLVESPDISTCKAKRGRPSGSRIT